MNELYAIVLSVFLVAGSHEVNHDLMADSLNVDMTFNGEMVWRAETSNPTQDALLANAGFEGQDIIAHATKGTMIQKPVLIVSALNKIGYAIYPDSIKSSIRGDVHLIKLSKGKEAMHVAQSALLLSALSDMLIAYDKIDGNMYLTYGQSSTGTPMIVLNGRF